MKIKNLGSQWEETGGEQKANAFQMGRKEDRILLLLLCRHKPTVHRGLQYVSLSQPNNLLQQCKKQAIKKFL